MRAVLAPDTRGRVGSELPSRDRAIDRVRGAVMVLMVLDHARDFWNGFGVDPSDLDETTPILFLTRWVTHFCAPGFILLAGAAAHLYGRNRAPRDPAMFLFTRGLWLVLLEVTAVRFGWIPEPFYRFTLLQVFWAIGCSMVLLAPLVWLPRAVLVVAGVAMIATHNLLDGLALPSEAPWRFLAAVLHQRQRFEPLEGHVVMVGYPLIPWIGVMAAGFGLGALFERPPPERQRWLLTIGAALSVAFVVLRAINAYGDPEPWSAQPSVAMTVASFLNCEKYPPSLLYLLMTLGPILLALGWLDRARLPEPIAQPLEIFGRVPLFFYLAHVYLLRIPGIAVAYLRYGAAAFRPPPAGHAGSPDLPLVAAYVAWIVALALLYPACRWYAALKQRRGGEWWWLRYL